MISTILITGGGSMMPGFPLRLENCLHTLLHREKRYIPLRGLSRNIHIINSGTHKTTVSQRPSNPVPSQSSDTTSEEGSGQAGTDFCWERSLLPWVGASLVGALKSGGHEEWTKESLEAVKSAGQSIGDWSRQTLE
jgi:actin-related protein